MVFNHIQRRLITQPVGNNLTNTESDVLKVKGTLNSLGHLDLDDTAGEPHGVITRDVQESVQQFQSDFGLAIDGKMNPGGETETAMTNELGAGQLFTNFTISPPEKTKQQEDAQNDFARHLSAWIQQRDLQKQNDESDEEPEGDEEDGEDEDEDEDEPDSDDKDPEDKPPPTPEPPEDEDEPDESEPEDKKPNEDGGVDCSMYMERVEQAEVSVGTARDALNEVQQILKEKQELLTQLKQELFELTRNPKDNKYCMDLHNSFFVLQKRINQIPEDVANTKNEIIRAEEKIKEAYVEISKLSSISISIPTPGKGGRFGKIVDGVDAAWRGSSAVKIQKWLNKIDQLKSHITQLNGNIEKLIQEKRDSHESLSELAEEIKYNCSNYFE